MINGTIFLHILCNMFVQLQNYQNYKSCAFVLYPALCKKKINIFLYKGTPSYELQITYLLKKISLLYLLFSLGGVYSFWVETRQNFGNWNSFLRTEFLQSMQ